jgi:salicylate hydroxylase
MLLIQGQGVSQSIEDAEVLGGFFADVDSKPSKEDVEKTLDKVFKARYPRVSLIQAYSREQAKPATEGGVQYSASAPRSIPEVQLQQ